MKKRFWILAVCLILLGGCGGVKQPVEQEDAESSRTSKKEFTIAVMELIESENPAEENLADKLQANGKSMMVQIEAGGLMGSGVLYDEEDGKLRIVSAAHIFEQAGDKDLVRIIYADAFESYSREYTLYAEEDIAIIYVALDSIPEESKKSYRLANVDYDAFQALQSGDGCIAMGSKTGVAAEAYEGTILDTFILFEDYGHFLLWAKAEVKPGMSGGGLFDNSGHFIGILSGGNEEGELAVVPLNTLWSKLY